MGKLHEGRWSGEIDDDFVVFLIGMRINRPWRVDRWLPVARAMGPMQAELAQRPELGCLHTENWFGRTTLALQYWRDAEALNAYAKGDLHLPAWRRFNRAIKDSGDVGIWHETYQVRAGAYETIYGNMPRFGLAAAAAHKPTREVGQSALGRMGVADAEPVVEPY
ncbi:MAG: DUF4188 domain-containing protein [Actinomycetota bacterium]